MKGKIRGSVLLLILVVLLASLSLPLPLMAGENESATETTLTLSPESQEFAQALVARPSSDGAVPEPISLKHATGQLIFPESTYPANYDLRSTNKLTPVKDQNPYGTCWAFASLASLESTLKPGETWDFSENHLARWSGFDNDPEGPYDHGGNASMAAAYLARWQGPVNESDSLYIDPYTPSALPVQKYVSEIPFLPPRASSLDNDTIKGAVITYGAVACSIFWKDSYFNSTYNAYYYNGSSETNHLVDIVGWNDNFDRTKFGGSGGLPPGNGAFIMRNSWGSGWGEGGYFYLSYYDTVLNWFRVFNGAEPTTSYGHNYQYDPLGYVGDTGYQTQTAWFCNVFTALASENLTAAAFYTNDVNASYEVYVKPNFNGSSFVGPLVCSGSFVIPGYHTVSFNSPIPITAGNRFCVAVKMTTPNYTYPIAMECPVTGYSSRATASPGQSYVSSNGSSWRDLTTMPDSIFLNANVCLKAFSAPLPTSSPSIGFSPGSLSFYATQGGVNPSAQTLSLWNAGGGTLNWNVSETASWLSLNPTSGSSSGESDGVAVNADISGLSTGTYHVTMTVSAAGASNTPQQVPVMLVVSPSGPGITLIYPLVAGWNMISVPLNLADPHPNAVFPSGWPLYAWDAVRNTYTSRAQIILAIGCGYWLKAPSAQSIEIHGAANGQASTTIPLARGWNMVGTPYHQPLPWGTVLVTRGAETISLNAAITQGWIKSPFYAWTGSTYLQLNSGGTFQPISGYWLRTLQDGCALVFTAP